MKTTVQYVMKRFAVLFLVYFFMRIFFHLYNHVDYTAVDYSDLLKIYANGLRFDISAILRLNLIFFIIWLIPLKVMHQGTFASVVRFSFLFINLLFVSFNIADAELIHFSGQRLTLNYFLILQDVGNQMGQLLYNYWANCLFVILIAGVAFKLLPQAPTNFQNFARKRHLFGVLTVFLFFTVLGVRGGTQNKPLKPAHAFVFHRIENGHLSLNSTFTLLSSGLKQIEKRIEFYPDDFIQSQLSKTGLDGFSRNWDRPQNVVILIMESWASEFVGAYNSGVGYTPFFDGLTNEGLLFPYSFANGRRSIEAVPAILASIPSLLHDAFLTSQFQGVELPSLGSVLQKSGYETLFFHGAENGSMFFDSFAARAGFSQYFGLNEYPGAKSDYDGFWGIYDEPFLQFAIKTLNQEKHPFAAVIFTLSSHQPYHVPPHLKGKFPKGELEIHESIGYADYALQQFFLEAKKQDWFKNTLFIITGDHTQKNVRPEYNNLAGQYRVPIFLYHPQLKAKDWPQHNARRVVQHIDIMPTVLDVLNVSADLTKLGRSAFDQSKFDFVLNRTPQGYLYFNDKHLIEMNFNYNVTVFRNNSFIDFRSVENSKKDEIEDVRNMKLNLQYFINGILDNKL